MLDEAKLLERITFSPKIFNGKPIVRGRRLAVEHVLGMLAAGDTSDTILAAYPWLEREDIQACLVFARRLAANERIEPLPIEAGACGFSSTPVFPSTQCASFKRLGTTFSGRATGVPIPEMRQSFALRMNNSVC